MVHDLLVGGSTDGGAGEVPQYNTARVASARPSVLGAR